MWHRVDELVLCASNAVNSAAWSHHHSLHRVEVSNWRNSSSTLRSFTLVPGRNLQVRFTSAGCRLCILNACVSMVVATAALPMTVTTASASVSV